MRNHGQPRIIDGLKLYPVPRTTTDFRYIADDTAVYVTSDGERVYTQTRDDQEPRNRERFYDRNGYACIAVANNIRVAVHRLVCLAFHGVPPTDAHVVARRNGIKTDNSPSNLYWATRGEANKAAFDRRNPPMLLDATTERDQLLLELNNARAWAEWYRQEPNPMLAEQWDLRGDEARNRLAELQQKSA